MTATEPGTDLVPVPQAAPPALIFGSDDPVQIVARVGAVAHALGDFIRHNGMSKRLESNAARIKREQRGEPPPKEYVFIDGWSFAGQMLSISAVTREVRDLRDAEGTWYGAEARVELVTREGFVVGGAISECTLYEAHWSRGREPFQLKSMAQTRAVGKAFRTGFGFVMQAAGFESTPGEEFVEERDDSTPRSYGPPAGRQPGQPPRAMQPRVEVEKRNGVTRIDVPTTIPQLFQAARYWLGYQADDVALALGADRPSELAPIIAEHLEGDYLAAFRVVVQSALDAGGVTDWQEPAPAAADAPEATEAAPVAAK